MKSLFNRIVKDEQGVLTFEWILLLALLVIGIVGGVATVRDALIIQLGSEASAILALDTSYVIATPVNLTLTIGGISGSAAGSSYAYTAGSVTPVPSTVTAPTGTTVTYP